MYQINKGINRSLEFRGIKAQYIIYLAAGLVVLLVFFMILYLIGIGTYLCLGIILPAGAGLFAVVQRYSKKYGEHGLLKQTYITRMPASVRASTRKFFISLKK